jgi:hypothetical protein
MNENKPGSGFSDGLSLLEFASKTIPLVLAGISKSTFFEKHEEITNQETRDGFHGQQFTERFESFAPWYSLLEDF